MKQIVYSIFALCLIIGIGSCGTRKFNEHFEREFKKEFTSVEIETLIEDSTLNVRALEIVKDHAVAVSSNGDFYKYLKRKNVFKKMSFPQSDKYFKKENNFRSISVLEIHHSLNYYLALSIGSPTRLFKDGILVYQENHPKAFYDSMEFWNDQEGIAIGDPTDDCISIIITRDGGDTWTKLSCDVLPKANEGEAAFAASDTNIAIVGDKTWVATGGKSSRILFSADKGKTWNVFETPIIQGKETTGMYSLDFYDENHGFAIGGDYTDADANQKNKIVTNDGGKTWQVVADGSGPGYRSCVQYVPNSSAQQLVAIGFKGIDYSADAGQTWKHLSDEGFYTLRFLNDSTAYAAGNGRISKLSFK